MPALILACSIKQLQDLTAVISGVVLGLPQVQGLEAWRLLKIYLISFSSSWICSAVLDCKGKGGFRFVTWCKIGGLITCTWSSLADSMGQRILVFIKQPVSDPRKILSVGVGTWRKCLFGPIVLSTQTLNSLFRNIAYFISSDLLGFFGVFFSTWQRA